MSYLPPTEEQRAKWKAEETERKARRLAHEGLLAPIFKRIDQKEWMSSGCGDGWADLLLKLDADLALIDPNYKVLQFKEKFGTLSYYFQCSKPEFNSAFHDRVSKAEALSGKTCEWCGQPGSTGGKGWIRTLCDKCRKGK